MKSPLKTPYVAATTTAAGVVSRMPGLMAWTTATAYRKKKRRCSRWLLIVSICEPAYLHGFVTARRFRAAGDRDART